MAEGRTGSRGRPRVRVMFQGMKGGLNLADGAKTIVFEREYNVSIDDFEDTVEIDRFIESKTGMPLKVNGACAPFTSRGGNIFKISDRNRRSVDESISKVFAAARTQRKRLLRSE